MTSASTASDLVFLTGPGGAGTTTLAAATALRAARAGADVLLLGVADAGELDAVLGDRAGLPETLSVRRFDAAEASQSALGSLFGLVSGPLAAAGFSAPDAGELGPVPGLPDILALRLIATEVASGRWDLVVVDGPQLRGALDMLAWPETAAAALRRLRPIEGQAARSLRPLLAGLVGLPSPMTAVTRWADEAAAEIAAVRAVLTGPRSVVRVVGSEARTAVPLLKIARTVLSLHGLRHDMETLAASAVPRQPGQPVGVAALEEVARSVYGHAVADAEFAPAPEPSVTPDGAGYHYDLPLPGVDKDALALVRSGDELVVTVTAHGVAGHRRAFLLPAALRRCRISSARLTDGLLRVGFEPDESLWPERLLREPGEGGRSDGDSGG